MDEHAAGRVRGPAVLAPALLAAVFASVWIWVAMAGAGPAHDRAVLRDLRGTVVGAVTLAQGPDGSTRVRYWVRGLPAGFHGFHIHWGGVCDASRLFDTIGDDYDHLHRQQPFDGDLPVILAGADGSGSGSFLTDRFTMPQVEGKSVAVHADPDNYANVPIGRTQDDYWPN